MRQNLPVTQREHPFPDGTTLMSMTDPRGKITYANAAFVAISGYSREELVGKAHNIVRHPDVPPAAFADMWKTLNAGQAWTGIVKNRRKNGDHYWVRANVAPIVRDGRIVGHLSVRTRPTAEEIQGAEALYKEIREGRAKGLAIECGLLVRTGLGALLSIRQRMSLAWRVRLGVLVAALPAVAAAAAVGAAAPVIVAVAAAAAAGALAAGLWLRQQVTQPIGVAAEQSLKVATGQPGSTQLLDRADDVGMLLRSVNQSGLNLRSLIDDVANQVDGLGNASREIAAGNLDLSQRTEQTAASLQQAAASMQQMTGNVRQTADSAAAAHDLAEQATAAAANGGQAVGQMVATMTEISGSSARIGEIVGVIDGIAFQTNLLALNAAVEAARAGEQGRGFAVVAAEVRALAKRSAEAAREIKRLIAESQERVEAGNRQAGDTGAAMDRLVQQVRRVGDLLAEISAAAREQSEGIGQVNEAVNGLDRSTQQNAALVEETAAAAASLRQQAVALSEAVAVFDQGSVANG
ncbi:MAG: methyl-accepting chemotaxis protein [Rubrivivax sp.]